MATISKFSPQIFETYYKSTSDYKGTFIMHAGINLTGCYPPRAFASKCVPSPKASAQQKKPGGKACK